MSRRNEKPLCEVCGQHDAVRRCALCGRSICDSCSYQLEGGEVCRPCFYSHKRGTAPGGGGTTAVPRGLLIGCGAGCGLALLILFIALLAAILKGPEERPPSPKQARPPSAKVAPRAPIKPQISERPQIPAPKETKRPARIPAGAVEAKVTKVIDGDTFRAIVGGREVKVRLIGVNTPEVHHPRKGREPYGEEAAAFTRRLIEGRTVYLTFDVQHYDKYGRLLAYVWLPDGTFLNALLVKEGYAQVMTIPPNVKYADLFLSLQRKAREEGKGLWALRVPEEVEKAPSPPLKRALPRGPPTAPYYVGSKKRNVFHRPDCRWAAKIAPQNLVRFRTREEALKAGYRPCKVCRP